MTLDFTSSKEDILSKIDAYDAIVIRSRFQIDKAFLDSAKHLRFIARVGSGLENIDVSYAKKILGLKSLPLHREMPML